MLDCAYFRYVPVGKLRSFGILVIILEGYLTALHKLATALSMKDVNSAIEAIVVLHHYVLAPYKRVQEAVDFFTDFLESGKLEAILLQNYFREEDRPFSLELYREPKEVCGTSFQGVCQGS